MNKTYPCPGHQNKCEFCKEEHGRPRYVVGMLEIDRQGNPKVDACCKACANNLASKSNIYQKTSIS